MKILVLNAGSSSQKSCLYEVDSATLPDPVPAPLWEAHLDWTHQATVAELTVRTQAGVCRRWELNPESRSESMAFLLRTLWSGETQVIESPAAIAAVGHRVVHGGQEYRESTRVTPPVKEAIARLAAIAPVHNPANLAGIESVEAHLGEVPQVAVFDTAFHSTLPQAAAVYPGPYVWREQGLRRYGFHGISYQYCVQRVEQILGPRPDRRMVIAHLGNGCSLAALRGGRSLDTTMGFTPLEGLMMGSRSGSVDPGLLLHLLRQGEMSVEELDRLLNRESGLKGISGISADMRQIWQAIAQGNPRAQLAFDIYVHRLRGAIASMLPAIGGLDALVFTAGVGEHHGPLRSAVCEGLAFLGLRLDEAQNAASPRDADIAAPDSTARILVLHTQEDWLIAQECYRLLTLDQ